MVRDEIGGVELGAVAVGIASFAYIWLRAITDPEPPLFYARPDTWERFRYLVLAEQFRLQPAVDPSGFCTRKPLPSWLSTFGSPSPAWSVLQTKND